MESSQSHEGLSIQLAARLRQFGHTEAGRLHKPAARVQELVHALFFARRFYYWIVACVSLRPSERTVALQYAHDSALLANGLHN